MTAGRRRCVMTYTILLLLTSSLLMDVTAITTNNRIALSSLLVGSALAASVYGYYNFSDSELALLTTAVLILTIPRGTSTPKSKSCADYPSYTDDPVIGCYRIVYISGKLFTYDESLKECASDGGRLILIRSAEAATALATKMNEKSVFAAYIQGTRTGLGPWKDDSGNPLPYIKKPVQDENIPIANTLYFDARSSRFITGSEAITVFGVVCEI